MRLALVDFDGTLTSKDTLPDFITFAVGKWKYFMGLMLISHVLILYLLKFISNDRAKEIMIGHFFKGWNADYFRDVAEQYSLQRIDKIIRPKALERIRYHKLNKDRIIIVSASVDAWIKPWCDLNQIELLSTSMEERNGVITGRFASKNCNGAEKAVRICEKVKLSDYDEIFAYGDTDGDRAMLSLATQQNRFYRYFH